MAANAVANAPAVRAVERAIELMFHVAERTGAVTLQQLADEVGCSKSTAYRLLGTLERLAVVERDPALKQYRLGPRLRALRQVGPGVADLRALAAPHLAALRDQAGETATLHVLDGAAHIIVAQCEAPHEIRQVFPLGQRIPLVRGATAKAILAHLPPAQRRQLAASLPTEEVLSAEEAADIRDLGYACSYAERVPNSAAISAPLRDARGWVCGAVSLSGPSFRFTPARTTRCAPALVDAAARIEAAAAAEVC